MCALQVLYTVYVTAGRSGEVGPLKGLAAVQFLNVPAQKLDFPLGSPLHAEAAHQERVSMDVVFSIQHVTQEEERADKAG